MLSYTKYIQTIFKPYINLGEGSYLSALLMGLLSTKFHLKIAMFTIGGLLNNLYLHGIN